MSTALYRRYRSARFGDLIGQPHIVATLLNEMRSGRIPHAYLFTGIRGTGKTSTARIVARAVNCADAVEGEPCNVCAACTEITSGAAVDVLEIDAASNRGIDDVRELRERVNYLPASLRRKVYIIDEAHMLTTDAWNAFLKTLEEPPPHVLFILATTEPHRVPETVRSRTQRFDFRRVSVDEIADHLAAIARREQAELEPGSAALLARSAQGSVRDALSLLDQVLAAGDRSVDVGAVRRALGLADPAIVRDILTALGRRDPAAAILGVTAAFDAGADPLQLLREVSRTARAAALAGIGLPPGGADPADGELVATLVDSAPARFWVEALELLGVTEINLKQVADARLQIELCVLRLVCPSPQSDAVGEIAALADRVAALESGGSAGPSVPATRGEPGPQRVTDVGAADLASRGGVDHPGDLAGWVAAWPRFLEAMNRRDFMLAGLLKGCRPVDASPRGLVIGALHQFHLEQIRTEPKPLLLVEVAAEIAGHAITVETVFAGQEAGRAADTEMADATQAALETFRGSRLVGSRTREPEPTQGAGPAPAP